MNKLNFIKQALKLTFTCLLLIAGGNALFAQTYTSNKTGTHDGYYYSFWTEGGGTASMTLGPDGNYSTKWTNIQNFTAGKGWQIGKRDRVVCFEGSYDGGTNGFLAVYGWTKNDLIEYYVVENHGQWDPPGNTSDIEHLGTFTSDGGTYDVYRSQRVNKPSIIGTATFYQFWSVRRELRSSGTVTFANHVDKWESYGLKLGSTWDYQIMESEGYGSSGSSNITVWECTTNDIEVEITAPTATSPFLAPASIDISATASTASSSIARVEFYNGTTKLGEDNSAPFQYTWDGVEKGSYSITAVAYDANGEKATSQPVDISVNVPQAPYGGSPHAIPGVIEFEEFDEGGNNSSYFDDTPGTQVTEDAPDFRTDEDVDIENCTDEGGGYNLGWTAVGEWTEYTVNVEHAGSYNIEIRAATEDGSKVISLDIDGKALVSDLTIPKTTDWQDWQTVTVEDVQLEAGEQIIRLTIGGTDDYVNLNKMTFISSGTPPTIAVNINDGETEFSAGEAISITADASSTNSSIAKVELFVDGKLIETDQTSPFAFDWSTVATGEHVIKVTATDEEGMSASKSTTINITEKAVVIPLVKGWNLVGYPHSGSADVETALKSIISDVIIVKDLDGFWDKDLDPALNSLPQLKWGKGYMVKVSNNCELEW